VYFYGIAEGDHRRSPASAASSCAKEPLPQGLSITAPEFSLVCTATTRSIGYIINPSVSFAAHCCRKESDRQHKTVDVPAFGIGDGSRRDYQRNGTLELRRADASQQEKDAGGTH
jgi:hypothetical protein